MLAGSCRRGCASRRGRHPGRAQSAPAEGTEQTKPPSLRSYPIARRSSTLEPGAPPPRSGSMYAVFPTSRAPPRSGLAPAPSSRRARHATNGGPVARFRLWIIFHVATRQWVLTVRAIGRLWTHPRPQDPLQRPELLLAPPPRIRPKSRSSSRRADHLHGPARTPAHGLRQRRGGADAPLTPTGPSS